MINGGELKTNPAKMEAIIKWPMPTNVYEVRNFVGVAQYLRQFITSFSTIVAPLNAIIKSGKSFY